MKPLLAASREQGRLEEARRLVQLALSARFPEFGGFPEVDSIVDIAVLEALMPLACTASLPEIPAWIRGSVS